VCTMIMLCFVLTQLTNPPARPRRAVKTEIISMKRKSRIFLGIVGAALAAAVTVGALLPRPALPAKRHHPAGLTVSASPVVDIYDHL
jgi:hypothetical protein